MTKNTETKTRIRLLYEAVKCNILRYMSSDRVFSLNGSTSMINHNQNGESY